MTVCNAIWKMQQFKVTDVLILALISIPEVGRLYPPISYSIFHHVLGKSILFSARASLCRKEAGHTANGRRRHSGRTVCWTSAKIIFLLYILPATRPCWLVYTYYICLSWLYITISLRRLFPTSRRQLSMPFLCAKLERPDDEGKYHRLFREKISWQPSAFLRTITKRYYTRRKAVFHHFSPKFLAPSSY